MPPTRQPVVPTWATPPGHAVKDLLTIAEHHHHAAHRSSDYLRGCADATGWACGWPVTDDQAHNEMVAALADEKAGDQRRRGVADTLAWLLGIGPAPLELPRRNSDGTLVTAEQRLTELEAEAALPWIAEQRRAAEAQAERDASRWRALADLR